MHTVSIKPTYSIINITHKLGKKKWQGVDKKELEERE